MFQGAQGYVVMTHCPRSYGHFARNSKLRISLLLFTVGLWCLLAELNGLPSVWLEWDYGGPKPAQLLDTRPKGEEWEITMDFSLYSLWAQ